eukprot:TRINITY_DN111132_c0_g1_i1.p1 TRINITY_DN111132_c0_g1~~TRINITY_DN111132_c0_g1_i1.p1  ORF type:complete len:393 (-),score=105.12 TRINITY_DN111132_c0_g1_i1:40-1143(-)
MAFCFMVLTIWSLVSVEVLHPIVQELSDEGAWPDCKDCREAFSSVMVSNLTLFQTVMTNDEFGKIAIPCIKAYPLTVVIFVGSYITVGYGILNLVVALVVDTFAEQRMNDDKTLAEDLDEAAEADLNFLAKMFDQIDENRDSELTLGELKQGARTNTDFRSRLRILDLDEADLEQLFKMLDEDGSGGIDKNEFINTLSRWREDSRTAARFVKYNMQRCLDQQDRMLELQVMQQEYLRAAHTQGSTISREPKQQVGRWARQFTGVSSVDSLEGSEATKQDMPSREWRSSVHSSQSKEKEELDLQDQMQLSMQDFKKQLDRLVQDLQVKLMPKDFLDGKTGERNPRPEFSSPRPSSLSEESREIGRAHV